jgi:nucleotide-binding universal stress UspA family protein
MLRSVLLPTDLGPGSELMLGFARGLPSLGVKRVVLTHVVDVSGMEAPVVAARVDEMRGRLREAARPLEDAGLLVETRIPTGDPQQCILALAHELQMDGIVCGSHGRGVVDQLFLGSVSDRIVREGELPRLVARFDLLRNAADPASSCRTFAQKLLVATDFSATSLRALLTALELPKAAVGTVYVLHALDPSLAGEKRRRAEEGAEFELKNLCGMAAERGISAKPVIGVAEPGHAILAEVDERRITGVVIGTRGRSPLQEALLGSVSMTLLRQASCPVMVVS